MHHMQLARPIARNATLGTHVGETILYLHTHTHKTNIARDLGILVVAFLLPLAAAPPRSPCADPRTSCSSSLA
eukprot:3163536-Pyramimonas_sp.AAC.1